MSTKRILKFPFAEGGAGIKCRFVQVLDIQIQNANVTAWVLTDSEAPEITIHLVAFGTGWEIPSEIFESFEYAKTLQVDSGDVWHYYMMKTE